VVTEINTPMSAPDLAAVSDRMPAIPARNATTKENASGRALVLVDAWLGLRWGEATELRGGYLDLDAGVAHVGRGVVRTAGGGKIVKSPKSDAGTGTWRFRRTSFRRSGSTWPAMPSMALAGSRSPVPTASTWRAFSRRFYPLGRSPVGQTLRHTGAVLAASTGATLAELMARMGHSTVGASLKYQHAASDRDAVIAGLLSELTTGTVTLIRQRA
jgi:integrase